MKKRKVRKKSKKNLPIFKYIKMTNEMMEYNGQKQKSNIGDQMKQQ